MSKVRSRAHARPPRREISWRRLGTALVASAVAATGLAFAARAFLGGPRPPERPAASVSPQISPLPPVEGQIVETVPLKGANAVAYGAGSIWVASLGSGSLQRLLRFDPDTGEQLADITVQGLTSWGVGGGGISFGAGGVWVVGSAGGEAVAQRIDPAVNEVVQTVTLGDGHPADVSVDESTVWVTLFRGPDLDRTEVVRLDSATGSVTARISLETPWARDVAAGEGAVWVLERE